MKPTSLEEFYRRTFSQLPEGLDGDIGHFNVFRVKDFEFSKPPGSFMSYNRKTFYKITLIACKTSIKYIDRTIEVEKNGLLFATPKVPYQYVHQGAGNGGYFCIFSADFLLKNKSGVIIDDLPIFRSNDYPVFNLSAKDAKELRRIFEKMYTEIDSDYVYKYDLLRAYVLELIHFGQKQQPDGARREGRNASHRVSMTFLELLERQFPIDFPKQQIELRGPKEYAEKLSLHVNHLNKSLKEMTGKTTTELISERIVREAKVLLKQTDWSISQIAFCLGFDDISHFSKFFKKQTGNSPLPFRS